MSDKSTMKVACPGCNKTLRIPASYSLKKYQCDECETKFYAPEKFGGYQLIDIISNDDCTSTHNAEHLESGRKCVIRRLSDDHRHDGAIKRVFFQESDKLENLKIEGVVKAVATGDVNGIPYVEFDHYGVTSLKTRLRKDKPSIEEICFMFLDIIGSFEACAENSLVHGNLKPSNIRYDEHGNVRILDFALSSALTAELIRQKSDLRYYNNAYYIAPETVEKGELTPASDIYSLGAMLYEAVSGKKPFESLSSLEAMQKKSVEIPEPPNHLRPGIPPILNNLIMSMIEIDPAKRPQFIVQIIAVLQKISEEKPNTKDDETSVIDNIEIDDGYVKAGPVPDELLKSLEKKEEEKLETAVSKNAPQITAIAILVIIIIVLSLLYFLQP